MIVKICDFKADSINDMIGTSYAGEPRDNTFMYIGCKVAYLIECLNGSKNCLVFTETGISVPERVAENNIIVYTNTPQYDYAIFATEYDRRIQKKNRNRQYKMINGSYIGENVSIGEESYIEPGCLIDHDVVIGRNALILSGSRIRNAIIGDNFICNENAVIGDSSFTMTKDPNGNIIRIPSLGRVIIHNNVEVGACNNITSGACGDTILEDNVKLSGLIYIGHEAHIRKNTQMTPGVTVTGFVDMGENSYVGAGAQIKNRLKLGNNSFIGIGATVIRNVDDCSTVVGNPAYPLIRGENN